MSDVPAVPHVIDLAQIPDDWPTHRHDSLFWNRLGRCVATFGFLEEMLGKAIFAFTATTEVVDLDLEAAYAAWVPKMKKALTDQLGALIGSYESAVVKHQAESPAGFENLVANLRDASRIRNVICHGSWGAPDQDGRSLPFFVNRKDVVWKGAMDVTYLTQLQRHTAELAAEVISTVTTHGWQFPGSHGPGRPIWKRNGP